MNATFRRFLPFTVGVLVLAGVAAVIAVPVVRRSDWWNTDLTVAAGPPENLASTPMAATVRTRWSAPADPGGAPQADPVAESTVVTAGSHRITGHDPATGRERWHYRRGNATLCDWVMAGTAVVAAFRHGGGCTDLVALDAGTGQRQWYRNTEAGADATLRAGFGTVVLGGPTGLVGYDAGTGLERWTYTKAGCGFGPPVVGGLGVAVVLSCSDQGTLLALHDLAAKKERWSVPVGGTDVRALTADQQVVVYGTFADRPALVGYDARGAQAGAVSTPDLAVTGPGLPSARAFLSTVVAWTGRRMVAVDLAHSQVRWDAPASSPVASGTASAVYLDGTDLVQRDPGDGQVRRRIPVSGTALGPVSRLARVGADIAAVTPRGTTVYG